MSAPALRPLSVGEVLDVAFKVYSKHWARLAATIAIVVVPVQIIDAIVRVSTISAVRDGTLYTNDRHAYNGGQVAIVVLQLLSGLLVTGVSFRAISEAYMGGHPSIRGSLGFAARRLHSILWVNLLVGILVVLGVVTLFIASIWAYVTFSVAVPVLLVEGLRGTKAMRRSSELVSGRRWPALGVLLIALIIVVVATSLLGGLLLGAVLNKTSSVGLYVITSAVFTAIISSLVAPVQAAVTTVLYYDLRVRKEGYDLALAIGALGLSPSGAPAPTHDAWGSPAPAAAPTYGSYAPPSADPSPFGTPPRADDRALPGGFTPPVPPDPVRRDPPPGDG